MEQDMKYIELDFTGCKTYRNLHYKLKDTLDFPAHYGCNLDALWDSLSMDSIYGCNAFISIKGIHTLPDDLKRYMEEVYPIFDRNKVHQQKFGDVFGYEILD